jgi:enoyl-CoA hydratase
VSKIVMDDGKANVVSLGMLAALNVAFDQAERDKTVVVLCARGKHFSVGLDLNVFTNGSAADIYGTVKGGADLALRILSFPTPVVTSCHGNAFPMGALLILASDFRFGANAPYRIGLNEVAIGLVLRSFGIEIARQRLNPAYFTRAVLTGEMFEPAEALTAGFFDRLVPAADLERLAMEKAQDLSKISMASYATIKSLARKDIISAIRRMIDEELTMKYAEDRVTKRAVAS